jgi:hypothetical protein
MHNCKETREQLTELLLDGADDRAEALLDQCGECRAEFEAVAATLRMTTRLRETVTPGETYWTSYHTFLRQRLTEEGFDAKAQRLRHAKAQGEDLKPGLGFIFASLRKPLRLCVKTFFMPLPMPLGVAVVAVGLVLALVAIRTARQPITQPQAPVVVQVPVEVPVVQQKVVTQVVYRDRKPRSSKRVVSVSTAESTVARSQKQPEDTLSGFKPMAEVKLTVIKGGSPNEK